ncbi:hypothetical protein HDA32_004997 [Spinactinospora alkalitolerans]|uniref:Lipoprotein n=1 Tax=Spinactinospora alkalitolerans TaxID=687207 RepID=A0A852U2Q6_9ACTN|nr:hypothetical protein [Spinactinospora alkalitolerans]NYE49877.1 hypothetical protein [Spinactinospora alkalitolerans]
MRSTHVAGVLCSLVLLAGCGGQDDESRSGSMEESPPASPDPGGSATADAEDGTTEGTEEDGGGAEEDGQEDAAGGADGAAAEVFVYNTHGNERGEDDRRPEGLVASEFTTFNDLEWRSWERESATARGDLSGTWCLPDCGEDPYEVTVTLDEPEEVDGRLYFTEYTVGGSGELPEEMREKMERSDGGRLILPQGS